MSSSFRTIDEANVDLKLQESKDVCELRWEKIQYDAIKILIVKPAFRYADEKVVIMCNSIERLNVSSNRP